MKQFSIQYLIATLLGALILIGLRCFSGHPHTTNDFINVLVDCSETSGFLVGYIFVLVGIVGCKNSDGRKRFVVGLLGCIVSLGIPQIVESCLRGLFHFSVTWDEGPASDIGKLCIWITLPVLLITWFRLRQTKPKLPSA